MLVDDFFLLSGHNQNAGKQGSSGMFFKKVYMEMQNNFVHFGKFSPKIRIICGQIGRVL